MFERISSILEDIFEIEYKITPDTTFEELFADYQDIQEIFMSLEEEFDIITNEKDITGIKTVRDIIDYINAKKD